MVSIDYPIRLMVVDDYEVVRSGLVFILKSFEDFEVVGEAADGSEALRLCESARPQVILMDIKMESGMDGISATRLIRERYPEVKVIMLTSYPDEKLVQGALRAGAAGYLTKHASSEEIREAIRAAQTGFHPLSAEATEALINAAQQQHHHTVPELTEREIEVITLMAQGLTNGQISQRLSISQSTVKTHVSNILTKIGAISRTEAVAFALQSGLVN